MDGKKRVLVIEDAPVLRKVLCGQLASDGFEVVPCSNGLSALQAAYARPVHAVITEFRMDRMNGMDVTRILRRSMPHLMIIGVSLHDQRKEFLSAGADFFLQKPYEYDDLVALLKK